MWKQHDKLIKAGKTILILKRNLKVKLPKILSEIKMRKALLQPFVKMVIGQSSDSRK